MPYYPIADFLGQVDCTDRIFEESIYLLDEHYRVVAARPATKPTGKVPHIGDDFFVCFPILKSEFALLHQMLNTVTMDALLFRAGERPMLAVYEFYGPTRLLMVAVPEGALKAHFDFPGAHAAADGWMRALHVQLTPGMLSRCVPVTAEAYLAMHTWLRAIHLPLFYRVDEQQFEAAVATVAVRLCRLAEMCGCHLYFDIRALCADLQDPDTLDLLLPVSLAVMMAVRRISYDGSIEFYAEKDYVIGPLFYAAFYTDEPVTDIPELSTMRRMATWRGELFEYMPDPNDPRRMLIRFSLRRPRLREAQGLKNDFPWSERFFRIHLLPQPPNTTDPTEKP